MSETPTVSVITPTYNRKHTLPAVFESLRAQTFQDLEWIIVDDGSTDGTAELVRSWTATFPIRFHHQQNAGKPTAVNRGIDGARGKYLIVLDSDDEPVPEAVATFVRELNSTTGDVCAVGALTMTRQGRIIGSRLPRPVVEMSMLEAYSRHGMTGDKWLAFKTDHARQFPFPVYGTEKFILEGVVFNRMARAGYRTRFIDTPLLVHEYLTDGLTNDVVALKARNPVGFVAYHLENISQPDVSLSLYYLKSAANIFAVSLLTSARPIRTALLLAAALPIGLVRGLLDRFRIRKRTPSS